MKKAGKLTGAPLAYMADSMPDKELYDLETDPDLLNNLAANPEYAEVLKQMRGLEKEWPPESAAKP